MSTLLSIRPGNPPQNNADRYRAIHTFDEI
jgi:hypothetical protein